MNVIVKDKSKVNIQDVRNKFRKWLSEDFAFSYGFESHYHWIDRKIFAEKFMNIDDSEDISDYKFLCFNGQSKLMQIVSERNGNNRRLNYITRNEGVKTTYARVQHNAYLSFKDICDETAKQLGIADELVEAIGKTLMKNAFNKACGGYRVELGKLLSLYPQVHKSIVDKIDKKAVKS